MAEEPTEEPAEPAEPAEPTEEPVAVEEDQEEEAAPRTESSSETQIEEEAERIEGYEQFTYKKVKSIAFGVLSPKMIKQMASAKIVTPELYDKEGYPVDGGLMDIRLGVIDPGLKCKTCGSKIKECIGHFGYIELARPIMHYKFIDVVISLLRSTCRECGRIKVPKQKITYHQERLVKIAEESGPEARLEKIQEIVASSKGQSKCPHCKSKQFKIGLEKPTTVVENEKRLSPIEIRARLEKISDEDCELFGLNPSVVRPEWMVLTIMAIPPVTMRPSITLESGERSEDDLTHKLGDIVRINQRLFENINAGAPEIIIEDLWDLLQYHITTFFDNDVAQLPPARHRSGQPLKTITERIKSKEGRIRHNLAGKRTNFSARTVVSPDPNISINEVGVPKKLAMQLTVPERVTQWNMAYLKKFVERGHTQYPGANYVIRPDGKKKKITDETREASLEEIQPGYTVERHLLDGDIAIFNRQPSLHRMSMMCHRVRVLPYRTLRLNPVVCNPYNADFDGDEMNLHIPQTEDARAEAEVLMEVQTQLISPRYGLSVMGCIQDAISGAFILTKDLTLVYADAIQLLAQVGITDFARLPKKKEVTGKEIFSVLIPEDFSFRGKSKSGDPVVIKKGVIEEGVLDSSNLGVGKGLLLRNLIKRYGSAVTVDIMENFFRLGTYTLQHVGFSVPISDSDLPEIARNKIEETLTHAEQEVKKLIDQFHQHQLEVFPGRTMQETLELKILTVLNQARNMCGEIVSTYCDKKTHTLIMADSGARGNILNLAQMAACVGQQALGGKRIERGYRGRTLSAFQSGDLSPKSRGFIKYGFKHGLAPHEFFFGAMTGRDSLMDTALRTPKSGYLYRRLANAMQDLKVEYDGTVRDASKRIIQFRYGEDGVDVSRSENGVVNVDEIIDSVR